MVAGAPEIELKERIPVFELLRPSGSKKILFLFLFFHFFTPLKSFTRDDEGVIYSMRKHFTISLLSGLLFVLPGFAQQDPQFSQHMFTKLYYNPGFAGANDAICGTLLYRNQWAKWDNAPTTEAATLHGPLGNTKLGWGGTIIHDHEGVV